MTVLSIYRKFRARAVDVFVLLSMLIIFVSQAAADPLDHPAAFNQHASDPGPALGARLHPTLER